MILSREHQNVLESAMSVIEKNKIRIYDVGLISKDPNNTFYLFVLNSKSHDIYFRNA